MIIASRFRSTMIDQYSAKEVAALDWTNFLCGAYPTLHSCGYIPASQGEEIND